MKIGHVGHANYAGIAHEDRANSSDYALIQNSSGKTIINSNSGQYIEFRKGNGTVGIFTTEPDFYCRLRRIRLHSTFNTGANCFQIHTNNSQGLWGLRFESHGTNNYNCLLRMINNSNGAEQTTGRFENDSGHTNTINNFTGQHRCIGVNNINATDMCGLIAYSTGKYMNIDNSISPTIIESLPICDICKTDNDIRVFGVISDEKDDNEDSVYYGYGSFKTLQKKTNKNEMRLHMNSVGEGSVWVCNKNGNISNGDYITSCTIPGYGAKQSDDLLHNYTVAKITCNCDFNLTKIVKQKIKVSTTIITTQIQQTEEITTEVDDIEIIYIYNV